MKTMTSESALVSIPQEHERRFFPCIEDIPNDLEEYLARSGIMQSYLEDEEKTQIREEVQNGTRVYTMCRKTGTGITRTEAEFEISEKEYFGLLKEGKCSLVKKRYYYEWRGVRFQYNVYYEHLHGYVQIEVEFDSHEEALAFIPPAWFGREVTDDSTHGNYSLAKYGIPKA